jgi:hypothetical protein
MAMLPTRWYNLKNKAISCDTLWEKLYSTQQKLLHTVNRCPIPPGERLLHKCDTYKIKTIEIAIMKIPWKLVASMPHIIVSTTAKS